MADIGMDLYLAYEDGYKRGKAETEAYLLHCGDVTPVTNADRIRSMTDEELAKFLCDISACDYCPVFMECVYTDNNDRSLLEWLRSEADG